MYVRAPFAPMFQCVYSVSKVNHLIIDGLEIVVVQHVEGIAAARDGDHKESTVVRHLSIAAKKMFKCK